MPHAALYRYRIAIDPPLPAGRQPLTERTGLVIALTDDHGHTGYGEVAPLPGFSRESLDQAITASMTALALWLRGQTIPQAPPAVRFGLASAHAHLLGELPDLPDEQAPLLAGSPQTVLERWRTWPGPRPTTLKLKVARQAPTADQLWLDHLLAIAPVRLRLDANRGWNLAMAQAFAGGLSERVLAAIDYIEEPLIEPRQLTTWAQHGGLPYALDESLIDLPWPTARPYGLAALVAKPTLLGGDDAIAELATRADAWQIPLVLSSSFESSLGLRHIARLAARYTPGQVPGIATWPHFAHDLLTPVAPGRSALAIDDLDRLWHHDA